MTSTISQSRAHLDEAHKAHRHVMPVVGHEEPAALVEQMGQDRQLDPPDDLLDEAGDMARIAQVAGDVLVLQPVHQISALARVISGHREMKGLFIFTTFGFKNESLSWPRP
jgi:hypothetical protein